MTTLYKLTDQHGYTRPGHSNALLWGPGVTHAATGRQPKLCSDGVIHAYTDPLLAALMNPAHAGYDPARLWRAEGDVVASYACKVGVRALTVIDEIDPPEVTTAQRVRFAILCAQAVRRDPGWRQWAERWLDGTDRSAKSARAASARAASAWTAEAEAAAAEAAAAAAWTAEAEAAAAAAWTAEAEAWAARAAAWAARATERPLDVLAIARLAMQEER